MTSTPPTRTTGRPTVRARAGAFVLAATLGLGTTTMVAPAQAGVVVAAPSATTTTLSLESPTVAYGETSTATVTVDTATNGPKPEGKVELTVGGTTLVGDVPPSGKVQLTLPLLDASTTSYAVIARFVPTDPTAFSMSSAAPASLTVTKDETTSSVTARHRVAMRKIVAKSFVTSAHGQVPTGKVRLVLRRNGVRVDVILSTLNANTDPTRNFARAKFLGVPRTGTYKVIAKYRGSANFEKSKGSVVIAD